ncbi:MAG: DNA mismatch repair protein MutS [Clostridiales bacterium]|nr:DNA mismatch repair protein MutS [Clostridiales bacterium]
MSLTPMMRQYKDIKENYKDSILFFRLGDFYEMFFEDAIVASKVLEITLTAKNCGLEEKAPMCGVPYHAADTYIAKLIDRGYKVAICEQVEDPATAKGIVKREVVQIITPGTVVSQNMLNEKDNNYLASVYLDEQGTGLAFCDISTGEICTLEIKDNNHIEILFNELVKLSSKEILINSPGLENDLETATDAYISLLDQSYYNPKQLENRILDHFKVKSLQGLGISSMQMATKALGSLLLYLYDTKKQNLLHLNSLKVIDQSDHMSLDKSTIRNLEITETLFEKKVQGSLIGVLDLTHTAMGSRKLKQWLKEPLKKKEAIQKRLDAVELLSDDILKRNNLKELLKQVYDLERLIGRITCGNTNARDLIALRNSIAVIPDLKAELQRCGDSLLEELYKEINDLKEPYELINSSITEDPPHTIREGGIIREGYSKELDELKNSIKDGQEWIANLEEVERNRTGIKNLKVGYNKVFGYYLEVTKSNYDAIPDNYIRKQTLVNSERFITPELKQVESVVLNAEAKINELEYQLFQELREEIQKYIKTIQKTANAIAVLDVLLSFAEVSSRLNYVKPEIDDSDVINIKNGRHPVLEVTNKDGIFVSNDLYLDRDKQSLLIITGPNMSGKSTYMRQTALIVLMAQAGCFVPADHAKIGLVDRIYTRIGASDNLAQGQSTFFVEMSELAYILNTATQKSLVILDEIGRGTSTYDGLSIAWATVEYLCDPKRMIRTLFATNYDELTVLEGSIRGLQNLNVDVKEQDGTIIFLHQIVKGSSSRSYGIHVAKLAGVPAKVLDRADEKLYELELESQSNVSYDKEILVSEKQEQLSIFDYTDNKLLERIKSLNLMEITPSQAFKILEELKDATEE